MQRVLVLFVLGAISIISALTLPEAVAVEPQSQSASPADGIKWVGWSDQVFDQAKKEHKLVILDLEAVWCHWCHVMEAKTYSNHSVGKIIGTSYIAVKVDQDSRPDLSNKYSDYGWPATIIFDSSGAELAKRAGYIPPEEMIPLLQRLAKTPKPEEGRSAALKYSSETALGAALRNKLVSNHVVGYDAEMGSWSHGQKFLEPDSVEYALTLAKSGDAKERHMALETLNQQQHLIDPVWGGVYQYSTHDDWQHPHFEKIMQVQADNIRAYCLGYLLTKDPKYLVAAESTYRFLTTFLRSPDGAFYTSMDADVVPGQHSDAYFRLSDALRRAQGIPRIDKHIYARENGWALSGILSLYRATGDKQYLDAAERAANWIVEHRSIKGGGFSHDESDAAGPYLGDSLYMGQAFLSLYEATGDQKWLTRAEDAAQFITGNFQQKGDVPGFVTAKVKAGAVAAPEPLLDENTSAVRFFNLLSRYTANKEYRVLAQSGMRYLATPAIAGKRKTFVAGILLADRELNSDPVHITIVAGKADPAALVLFQEALKYPLSYKEVEWYDKQEGPLPSGAADFPALGKAAAFGCAFKRCSLPIFKAEGIAKTVDAFARSN